MQGLLKLRVHIAYIQYNMKLNIYIMYIKHLLLYIINSVIYLYVSMHSFTYITGVHTYTV